MRVLSGIQPSGRLHIGNYFGAMRQHLELQAGNESLYFIANYHALTSLTDADLVRQYTRDVALDYLALGLDPKRTIFFRQSDVPQVTELSWIFGCITPMGLLERCVSYKDKIEKGIPANAGLFTYPVLQAADILIYRSQLVPVGADQKQHIEVTRDVAIKFNNTYGEILVLPEPHILKETAVVPGVDGQKMSKSYDNTIEIFAESGQIKKKVMRIVTDSTPVEQPKDPDKCNVFALLRLVADSAETAQWADRYRAGGMGYGDAKKRLAELLADFFAEARVRRAALEKNPDYVEDVLADGGRRARAIADPVMEDVRKATGIVVARK
ncbi:MAG: Tryptophan--tRNA ligase [Phycisphaerae bacterium]|nr:Tryptophan--tRNA ligase [Phycisphaerae bacterium]